MTTVQFEFDITFQAKLLSLLLRDSRLLAAWRSLIRPEYFTTPEAQTLVRWVFGYHDQYHTIITTEVLRNFMRDQTAKDPKVERIAGTLQQLLNYVTTVEVPEREYILEAVEEFCAAQEYSMATIEIADRIRQRSNLQSIPGIIRAAEQRLAARNGVTGFRLIGSDEQARYETLFSSPLRDSILTPWPTINQICGGPAKKELFVIAAPPGRGKTFALCNLLAAVLLAGLFGVYYTLEMGQKLISLRVLSRLTGRSRDEIMGNPGCLEPYISQLRERGSEAYIEDRTNFSVEKLRDSLLLIQAQTGRMPDAVFVDYADLMTPRKGKKADFRSDNNEYRLVLAAIYHDLREVAVDLNVAVITVSHTNRASVSKERLTMADLAEAYGKAWIADIIIALCQTEEEERANRGRFYFAKNRNDAGGQMVGLVLDFDTAAINEDVLNTVQMPVTETLAQTVPHYLERR